MQARVGVALCLGRRERQSVYQDWTSDEMPNADIARRRALGFGRGGTTVGETESNRGER